MAIVVPGLAAEVSELSSNAYKAGQKFSTRERLLLASIKNYVDTLPAGSITLAELSSGIAPSHVVKYAGKATATAGATYAVTVTGVAAADIVVATFQVNGTLLYIKKAVPTTNTITFTADASFAGSEVIAYQVLRAAS